MRYSDDKVTKPTAVLSERSSNRAFFETVSSKHRAGALRCALLLIGGSDWRSLALRRAQATLRFDRRASLWSHVALIARWDADNVGDSVGLEVSLEPASGSEQAPERNGVTTFKLSRYFNAAEYPNVAVVAIDLGKGDAGNKHKDAMLDAACNPLRDRERYPLWNALSSWARYAYAPDVVASPFLEGIALPSAAFCEYAFESAGVDITPGATSNNTCPELIWSTVNHWQARMKEQVTFDASLLFRDPTAASPDALPMTIELPRSSEKAASKKAVSKKSVSKKAVSKKKR